MSVQATPAALELNRRREAIAESGWGLPFTFVQPRNLCFWVYVVVVAVGVIQVLKFFGTGVGYYGPSLIIGLILFGLYGALIWTILRVTDHYERQPLKLVITAFVWGGTAAAFGLALTANDANSEIFGKLFGQAFVTDWFAALSAPLVEETSKAAGFILLMALAPRLVRSVYDGIFLGAFIGLGFELFENLNYAYQGSASQFGADQFSAVLSTFITRVGTGFASHTLYTAVFCAGLIFLIGTPVQTRRAGVGIGLIAVSIIIHGAWDGAAAIGDGGSGALLVMMAVTFLGFGALIYALRRSAGTERAWFRDLMAPEVSNATISGDELDALTANRRQRKKFIRSGKGHKNHKNAKHVLRASRDLAEEIAKADGGTSPGVERARSEIERLRHLQA